MALRRSRVPGWSRRMALRRSRVPESRRLMALRRPRVPGWGLRMAVRRPRAPGWGPRTARSIWTCKASLHRRFRVSLRRSRSRPDRDPARAAALDERIGPNTKASARRGDRMIAIRAYVGAGGESINSRAGTESRIHRGSRSRDSRRVLNSASGAGRSDLSTRCPESHSRSIPAPTS